MNERIIEARKIYSKIRSEARKKLSQDNKCFYCEKESRSFKNSHSIPRVVLKSLNNQEESLYFDMRNIINGEFFGENTGQNKAGTFYMLCDSCERSELFESQIDNLLIIEEQDDYNLYLDGVYKHNILKRLETSLLTYLEYQEANKINELSSEELIIMKYYNDLSNETKVLVNNHRDGYVTKFNIGYKRILDYKVDIACQVAISIDFDFNNKIVKKNRDIINLIVYPYKEQKKTLIMLFVDESITTYDGLFKQLNKSKTEQLDYINYLMLEYAEELFISLKYKSTKELLLISDYLNLKGVRVIDYAGFNLKQLPNLLEKHQHQKYMKRYEIEVTYINNCVDSVMIEAIPQTKNFHGKINKIINQVISDLKMYYLYEIEVPESFMIRLNYFDENNKVHISEGCLSLMMFLKNKLHKILNKRNKKISKNDIQVKVTVF